MKVKTRHSLRRKNRVSNVILKEPAESYLSSEPVSSDNNCRQPFDSIVEAWAEEAQNSFEREESSRK